jgi:hypothetical protein
VAVAVWAAVIIGGDRAGRVSLMRTSIIEPAENFANTLRVVRPGAG